VTVIEGSAADPAASTAFRNARPAPEKPPSAGRVVPYVRVFAEPVVLDLGGYGDDFEESVAPLMQLGFRYPDLRRDVRANDPTTTFFAAASGGVRAVPRDVEAEANARRVLESFGAIDLDVAHSVGVPPDVDADYVVRLGGNRHDHCGFVAYALPQLRRLGWVVDVADDFPFQVVDAEVEYYADVQEEEERPDWFALELGVKVGGRKVNLLPALLELLDDGREGETLHHLHDRRGHAVEIAPGQHVVVGGDVLRALVHVVIELYEGTDEALSFALPEAPALEALDEAFASSAARLRWRDPKGVRQLGAALAKKPEPRVGPQGLQATLRPYQEVGLGWLQHLRANDVGGVLADDMGLGKTLQTIAHITTEHAEGRLEEPALVIAPTSLVQNWSRELKKFAPHLRVVAYHGSRRHERWEDAKRADVVLTSYPILLRDEGRITEQPWHLAILDEAHAIKNHRSRIHRACRSLDARHRLALTGTPVENHLGELWALFDFLNPEMLGSHEQFRAWYRTPIEKYRDEERLRALHAKVSPFILRRLKKEVATELPPKTTLLRPVELNGKQRELYEAIRVAAHAKVRSTIRRKGMSASTIAILDALMKLRQLCCDPRLVRMHAARFVRESAKYEAFFELLETQLEEGHRVLVFSQFTSMLNLLAAGLKERGLKHLMLTGATKDRQGLCDRFEAGEADVFLISLKAGGTGLNLVSADTVIHYDPWWNPQAQAQATDRAYRIGQTRPVFVYELFVAGSVEERMLALQRRKRQLADAILAGEVPDQPLSEEDLDILFAPLL